MDPSARNVSPTAMEITENIPKNTGETIDIPPLRTLYFYLTGDCNMACRHCWIAPDFLNADISDQALPLDLFKKIIREGKEVGLTSVKLTGGEPTIHPDIIPILRFIRDEGLGLSVESNGVAMTPHIADLIKSCKDYFISISIDGMQQNHEWMRGVPGSFLRACQGVRTLVDTGIHPQVIMAVSGRNKDEIARLAHYARDLGAASVKYNFVTPTARGEIMDREGATVPVREQIQLSNWIQKELRQEIGIPLMDNLPTAFSSLSSLFGSRGNCGSCAIFTILGVLHDGTYALCGIGKNIPALCFGHASTGHIRDIWQNEGALNEIRAHLPGDLKGICSRCLMKNVCLGHCIASNYYTNHDLLAGHTFCEQANEAGVFPETRLSF
jgi:SynChlorMet cassette radical SAM/SPASM protein ScmF